MTEIFIFTNSFPYGPGETFFKEELEVISQKFDRIYLQPLNGIGVPQSVPHNVEVLKPIFGRMRYLDIIINGILHIGEVGVFTKVFNKQFTHSVGQYLISRKVYNTPHVRRLLKEVNLKYFYWGKGAASICIFFPVPGKKAVRFHGFDLYEHDVRQGNIVSMRIDLLKKIDKLFFISEHGRSYLEKKYQFNGEVQRLGINSVGDNPTKPEDSFVIVSCSNLLPVKRVDFLAQALSYSKSKILWIHIGDGPEREKVTKALAKLPADIETKFLGHKNQNEVLDLYKEQHIDLFVNVSTSEGIPFSMMEAISFGIPIMGTNVGGTSEIITNDTGLLVDVSISPFQFAQELDRAIKARVFEKLRKSSKFFYSCNFNAQKNYTKFTESLLSLI